MQGSELRALRIRAGLSQDELAARSGVSTRTIRGLETGRIRSPHASTLTAIGDGLGLAPRSCAHLVRNWTRSSRTLPADEIIPRPAAVPSESFRRLLAERQQRDVTAMLSMATTVRVTIGPSRRIDWIHRHVVREAVRDCDARYLYTTAMDQASDVRLLRIDQLVGCALVDRVDDLEGNMSALEFSLGAPARKGELRTFSYREVQGWLPSDDPVLLGVWEGLGYSDTYCASTRTEFGQLSLQVDFVGCEPAQVWEVAGRGTWERLRTVEPDEFGSVSFFHRNLEAGSYGFEWAWPTG